MTVASVKQQVRQLAEQLPEDVTWEQVQYEIYVRRQIQEGEQAIDDGRTLSHEEVVQHFSSS